LPVLQQIPLVVDLVDVDSEKWSDYARRSRMPKALIYRREARRLRAVERELGLRAAAVTQTTEAERTVYDRHVPEANCIVMGNGVLTDYFRRPDETPSPPAEVVFVGAMDYRPNVEGIAWYASHVWPEVRRQVPEAVLRIVGRRPTAAVRALADVPGIQIHADVPDVRPYLFGARASVVPLFVARGIQNKILEAMACETPVIASQAALTGLDVVPDEHALAAAEPAEWIEQTVRLLTSEDTRTSLARAARLYVETRCNWEEQIKPLMAILEGLAPETNHQASHRSGAGHNESIPVAVDYACR
jgi:sugar transferase (PEP-CTERM/EpsH1 system associated)